jgi:ribosome-associated translation inhibitor RaiA
VQRHLYEAEFVVQQKGVTAVGAKEHASNARAVIDTAAARAEKQLRKMLTKRTTAHVRKAKRANG